jgi:hypothetical protein
VDQFAGSGHLDDHESRGEATLFVLRGHIMLVRATQRQCPAGEYRELPAERHNLVAVEDSAVLLTAVAR